MNRFLHALAALALSLAPALTRAQDAAALKAEIDALRALVPSQSHAMMDVDYHFSNLWFAAANDNWPLAQFYLNASSICGPCFRESKTPRLLLYAPLWKSVTGQASSKRIARPWMRASPAIRPRRSPICGRTFLKRRHRG